MAIDQNVNPFKSLEVRVVDEGEEIEIEIDGRPQTVTLYDGLAISVGNKVYMTQTTFDQVRDEASNFTPEMVGRPN